MLPWLLTRWDAAVPHSPFEICKFSAILGVLRLEGQPPHFSQDSDDLSSRARVTVPGFRTFAAWPLVDRRGARPCTASPTR